MVDRPPPSRFSVVERGGRLVVIDRNTGATPPSAAERMAEYDRRMGNEPVRPAARRVPEDATLDLTAPVIDRVIEAPVPPTNPRMAAAVRAMNGKRPWQDQAPKPGGSAAVPARVPHRPTPLQAGERKTIVTGKWWDAKGPRTIELGPQGQRELTARFMTLFFVALIGSIILLFIQPVIFFVGAFLLFRMGGQILGPIGASILDKAMAQKG